MVWTKKYLLMFAFFFLSSVSALSWSGGFEFASVNNSQFWQGYTPQSYNQTFCAIYANQADGNGQISNSSLNSLYLNLSGTNANQQINVSPQSLIAGNLTSSSLTRERVPFTAPGGLLDDDASFRWNSTDERLTIGDGTGNYGDVFGPGKLDVTVPFAQLPRCVISFRREGGNGDWGINLGSETVANIYIGGCGSTQYWFWRAAWFYLTPANTFQSPEDRAEQPAAYFYTSTSQNADVAVLALANRSNTLLWTLDRSGQQISTNITPIKNNTDSLGNITQMWKTVYANNYTAQGLGGVSKTIGLTDDKGGTCSMTITGGIITATDCPAP